MDGMNQPGGMNPEIMQMMQGLQGGSPTKGGNITPFLAGAGMGPFVNHIKKLKDLMNPQAQQGPQPPPLAAGGTTPAGQVMNKTMGPPQGAPPASGTQNIPALLAMLMQRRRMQQMQGA